MLSNKNKELKAYCDGELISIDKVNDEIFANKIMGDGVAIRLKEGKIYAPCDGRVKVLFEQTNHAIGIGTDDDMEILIHCGLDTIYLKDKVFNCKVKRGTKVKTGQLLITFDQEKIKKENFEDITMLVITGRGKIHEAKFVNECIAKANETVICTLR